MIVKESSNTQPPQPSRTVTPSQEPVSRRRLLQIGATSAAGLVVSTRLGTPARAATTQTVVVSGSQSGVSPPYIGATEGNVRFDVADLQDAGINTYRIYGGMSRWEWQNDSSTYGSPTIDQIKANPGVINWTWWDNAMTTPPNGSDYWWSGDTGLWQGNARTIFTSLQSARIRPVLTVRNRDNNNNPSWSPNPPTTTADWNEWWEHVFATVYWLNVRNNYGVDDYEVHNEPDNSSQGWGGTEADYFNLAHYTADAIRWAYSTYLPGRAPHIYAPVTTGGSSWPLDALQQLPTYFDSIDVHDYDSDVSSYVQQVHGWMDSTGHSNYPLWLSEWGTYTGGYDNVSTGVKLIINNLIRMSGGTSSQVNGSHLFSFYDWNGFSGKLQNFQGLVDASGAKRASYYTLRMAVRALLGARPTYTSNTSNSNLTAITAKDSAGGIYLLVTNTAGKTTYPVNADLSALITSGTGTMWQVDRTHNDVVVASPVLSNGHVSFSIPGQAGVLLKF
jgi:hypothetical protein